MKNKASCGVCGDKIGSYREVQLNHVAYCKVDLIHLNSAIVKSVQPLL